MGILDFFTFKSSAQLYREDMARKQKAHILATPHGLRSEFGDKQKALDESRSRSEQFLADIERHFGRDVKYLNPEYTGRSKYENIEIGYNRKLGVRWVSMYYKENDITAKIDIAFAYVETRRGVRVDYIVKKLAGGKKVVNEDYDPDADDIYKTLHNSDDSFRTVRRYENHDEFVNSGDRPPDWFIAELSHRQPVRA